MNLTGKLIDTVTYTRQINWERTNHDQAALLEVDVEHAEKFEIGKNDKHKGKYIEYTTTLVTSEQIKRILIPAIFKKHIDIPPNIQKDGGVV